MVRGLRVGRLERRPWTPRSNGFTMSTLDTVTDVPAPGPPGTSPLLSLSRLATPTAHDAASYGAYQRADCGVQAATRIEKLQIIRPT